MTRLRLLESNVCPPDKFRFTFREDGYTVRCFAKYSWLAKIRKHAVDNGYVIPTREEAEDQLCRLLPPGWCEYEDGSPPNFYVNSRITIADVMNGTAVLGAFIAAGLPLVPKEEAEARGKTCAACYANIQIPGCSPCVGLANLVTEIAGSTALEADAFIENKSCVYCKCASRANCWVPVEISERGVSDEVLEQMPEHCWKKRAISEARRVSVDSE